MHAVHWDLKYMYKTSVIAYKKNHDHVQVSSICARVFAGTVKPLFYGQAIGWSPGF